ncbi:sigma-54-dependent transcriptional regulator [Pelagerythrobacter sp.]|uniref:sigma-54-dependent transcriptional regulator n=1 Tax=Pelagerythrobacter sp. TaxID=2800702 RepID=UPI0035ADCC13
MRSGRAILLIDDNPAVARAMEIAFGMAGHALDIAPTPEEAFSRLARRHYDAIVLDLNFTAGKTDGREGLACLKRIMADDPSACVVVLTAHGGMRTAVTAMQAGARDFAVKPWNNADLIAKVEAAIARRPAAPVVGRTAVADKTVAQPRLLGNDPAMEALRDLVRRVGPTEAGVAVTGPPGAGRTLAALALHAASAHTATPPLRIDLRDEAAWAALDGARGTVTLRHADRLDEIAQGRLLARLPADARAIAIGDSVAELSPALRRRIATVELAMPPLAQRTGDIPLLADHFLRTAAERFGRPVPRLTPAAEAAIRTTDWPDEVRGLALAMERAVLLADSGVVDAATLSPAASPALAERAGNAERDYDLDRSEKAMIAAALAEHRHNVSHAARALGLSRGALYRRMERYGL